MADTVHTVMNRLHEVLVDMLTRGAPAAGTRGLHEVVERATALGPEGAWLAAAGRASLGGLAAAQGQLEVALFHLEAAVDGGFNDCLVLHMPPMVPLHGDPRFRALYARMRISQADLDELVWLHREAQIMMKQSQGASMDNIDRLDTGVSLLPQAPLPTREPDTVGVLMTRIDLAATQTALQAAAVRADLRRASDNVSLSLIDDSWDYGRARRDAWYADGLESHRLRAGELRAFVERPGVSHAVLPCPPLGSITYPG
ncbi:hypothetical protein ACIA8O_04535 [Kitasatospora sp. NPDC051853]|uniref:hypothetical protein n=1 Tax=Kitasatospora sp. NPDC051853 TaxID=3364058 RepID=UPI0037A3F445